MKKDRMATILLVEDEVNIASFIERGLREFGHEVQVAHDGEAGLSLALTGGFQLLILDIIMPKIDGLQLCRQYRQRFGYRTPVIMLTALGTTEDIVAGLDAGADDYLVKPFSFQELEARIKALLRRGAESPRGDLSCGSLILDPLGHRAIREGVSIDLTSRECRLLEYLIRNQGTAVARTTLLRDVWDKDPADTNTNLVDVYVNYLRAKIDKDFSTKLLRTVVGVGYMMES